MEHVEAKLKELEAKLAELNDGTRLLGELINTVNAGVVESVQEANGVESIDERITLLVSGLQKVVDTNRGFQSEFMTSKFILTTKISALEEVLDEYIVDGDNDLAEE